VVLFFIDSQDLPSVGTHRRGYHCATLLWHRRVRLRHEWAGQI